MRGMKVHRLSIESDFASIRALRAGQDLHQGAFTRTILTNQSVNFARPDRQIHAFQRTDAGETLGHPAYRKDRLARSATWSSLGTR
jgi:hypothetical protein